MKKKGYSTKIKKELIMVIGLTMGWMVGRDGSMVANGLLIVVVVLILISALISYLKMKGGQDE
jgi:hypothetical protein